MEGVVRTISEQDLKDILDKHGKWLKNEDGGCRANLSSANLSSADLSSADLSSADLSYADLRYAKGFKFKPIQMVNTKFFVTIFDDHVLWGCRRFTFDEVKVLELKDCQERWDESEFKLNKNIITECIRYYRRE